jgi:hypothetical protein
MMALQVQLPDGGGLSGVPMRIWRMSAHRSCGAGRHRPRRPGQTGQTGQTGDHHQVGRAVRRDAPAIGKQRTGVLKHHHAVTEQAPSLFGMGRHDVGRLVIRCVRGRTGRLMLAHDAPRWCCRPRRPCLRRRSSQPIRGRRLPCPLAVVAPGSSEAGTWPAVIRRCAVSLTPCWHQRRW